ncbi:hypothetical protein BJ508DRAFT_377251 [Ascobolus immersus RN42]|uniref:MYND-type domain-containing protein n=1 Tax=Ascobolus immersus RN42 TaxID=1160509 RepID=A0A3N4I3Z4_ASCIM|nr:hypothetical protein BJ508DRAFT_377251 [Ascobolus immersus RN42]
MASNSSYSAEEAARRILPPFSFCYVCKKIGEVKKCGRCQTAAYCSKACQKAAWPTHKPSCIAPSGPGEGIHEPNPDATIDGTKSAHFPPGFIFPAIRDAPTPLLHHGIIGHPLKESPATMNFRRVYNITEVTMAALKRGIIFTCHHTALLNLCAHFTPVTVSYEDGRKKLDWTCANCGAPAPGGQFWHKPYFYDMGMDNGWLPSMWNFLIPTCGKMACVRKHEQWMAEYKKTERGKKEMFVSLEEGSRAYRETIKAKEAGNYKEVKKYNFERRGPEEMDTALENLGLEVDSLGDVNSLGHPVFPPWIVEEEAIYVGIPLR